jgi:hypothetical protein
MPEIFLILHLRLVRIMIDRPELQAGLSDGAKKAG